MRLIRLIAAITLGLLLSSVFMIRQNLMQMRAKAETCRDAASLVVMERMNSAEFVEAMVRFLDGNTNEDPVAMEEAVSDLRPIHERANEVMDEFDRTFQECENL